MAAILLLREPKDNTQNSLRLLNFPEYSRPAKEDRRSIAVAAESAPCGPADLREALTAREPLALPTVPVAAFGRSRSGADDG